MTVAPEPLAVPLELIAAFRASLASLFSPSSLGVKYLVNCFPVKAGGSLLESPSSNLTSTFPEASSSPSEPEIESLSSA